MPKPLYIFRRVLNDGGEVLQQIYYSFTEEGLVDIHRMSAHLVDDDGVIGPNFFKYELDYVGRLSLLGILVEEGVIDIL